jgi:hypothetical protein
MGQLKEKPRRKQYKSSLAASLIKKKYKFSSYIKKFRGAVAKSYRKKGCLNAQIFPHIGGGRLSYIRQILFSFLSVDG